MPINRVAKGKITLIEFINDAIYFRTTLDRLCRGGERYLPYRRALLATAEAISPAPSQSLSSGFLDR